MRPEIVLPIFSASSFLGCNSAIPIFITQNTIMIREAMSILPSNKPF
jgi:hypothetical protein